jgi:tetraacyldisaccharide 4'-kinase
VSPSIEDVRGRHGGARVVERAPVYGWARRAVYGGGGTAGRMARGLGAPLGWVWGAAAQRRLSAPASGARLSAAAISVGNVTLGGGGKTSLVEWIVREGAPPGATVAVLSRGYGRHAEIPLALAPGQTPARIAEAGDEPALLARAGAWVGVSADRFLAARAVEELGARPHLYVLDDGLQHRAVPRALDLVAFTRADLFAPARCVPAGPLRQRASWVPPHAVWVVAGTDPRGAEWPAGSIGRAYSAWWRELPGTSADWEAGGPVTLASWLARGDEPFDPEVPVVVIAGVARPETAGELTRAAGLEVEALAAFPDHHLYSAREIARLRTSHPGAAFVMTEKDAVKCEAGWFGDAPAGVLKRRLVPRDPDLLRREIADAIAWRE